MMNARTAAAAGTRAAIMAGTAIVAACAAGCGRPSMNANEPPTSKPGQATAQPAEKPMGPATERFETKRLVIRRFTAGDWSAVQVLAADKESSKYAKYDHAWPTSEAGCKQMAEFFARDGVSWAVCRGSDGKLVGFIRFNDIDRDKRLDLGHVFLSTAASDDYATEAIGRMMDHAFTSLGVEGIICENPDEYAAQLAPLRNVGMKVLGRGKGSVQKDADGRPIEFMGCRMGISRQEWLDRSARMSLHQ